MGSVTRGVPQESVLEDSLIYFVLYINNKEEMGLEDSTHCLAVTML